MKKHEAEWRTGMIPWFPQEFRDACTAIYGLPDTDDDDSVWVPQMRIQSLYFEYFCRRYDKQSVAHYMLRFERIITFLWSNREALELRNLGKALPNGFVAHPDLVDALCSLRFNSVVVPEVEYAFDYEEVVAEANRLREQHHR